MQKLLEEKQKAENDAEAVSKNTVIKVLMGEVQVHQLHQILFVFRYLEFLLIFKPCFYVTVESDDPGVI